MAVLLLEFKKGEEGRFGSASAETKHGASGISEHQKPAVSLEHTLLGSSF